MLRSVLYSENAARQIPKPPMTFEISGEGLRRTDVMATESRASSVHGKRWNSADAKTKKEDMTVDTQRTSTLKLRGWCCRKSPILVHV